MEQADFHNGDRQPCIRWESRFPKMRDCPSYLCGAKYDVFASAYQKCAYVYRSNTYLLTSPLFHPFVLIFCCLFSPTAVLQMCRVQTMEFISMLACCPSAAVLLCYCATSRTKNYNYNQIITKLK